MTGGSTVAALRRGAALRLGLALAAVAATAAALVADRPRREASPGPVEEAPRCLAAEALLVADPAPLSSDELVALAAWWDVLGARPHAELAPPLLIDRILRGAEPTREQVVLTWEDVRARLVERHGEALDRALARRRREPPGAPPAGAPALSRDEREQLLLLVARLDAAAGRALPESPAAAGR